MGGGSGGWGASYCACCSTTAKETPSQKYAHLTPWTCFKRRTVPLQDPGRRLPTGQASLERPSEGRILNLALNERGPDRALQTPANPTHKPKALRDSERKRDSRAVTVLPLTTLPRTKANMFQLPKTTSLLQHSIGSQRQSEREREREREHASANMSLQLSFLMYWCWCVCVCMSREASSLKELGPRLLLACSQNLTQNNMQHEQPQKFLRHVPENRSCQELT